MPTFLIESFQAADAAPPLAGLAALAADSDARHRWSVLLPDDEICFHVVEAASIEFVRAASLRAGLRCDRVSLALVLANPANHPKGGLR